MIDIKNLVKRYGDVEALKGVSLRVNEGELFAYLGPNGSGKTTTINILTGLTRPTAGEVFLNGHSMTSKPLAAKKMNGLVPQTVNLDSELSVRENLDIHGMLFHMAAKDRSRRIDELLDYVELSQKENAIVKTLSGGMKRRLMVARALMHNPKILFMDEPTVGLDPSIRRRIWSLIRKIQQEGATIFLTTHYIEEAEFLADRVALLDEGRLVAIDTPQSLMSALGEWALDELVEGEIRTLYFRSKNEANAAAGTGAGFTIRRVNLEDAFIHLTGRKVVEE